MPDDGSTGSPPPRRRSRLVERLRGLWHRLRSTRMILIDYPVSPRSRWPHDRPHEGLRRIIDASRDQYADLLRSFLQFAPNLLAIPREAHEAPATDPCWINSYVPVFDGIALYGLTALTRPRRFFEIGSGNSTKFVARAVRDHGLPTEILSVDPQPRAEIDRLCSRIIRQPVEETDPALFDELEANDILYVDCSHRVFMNSDATTVFLDIIPRLKPGVLVGIHDIMLPYDYPQVWARRFYSEQYLLACYLLAEGRRLQTVLPTNFVVWDGELRSILQPVYGHEHLRDLPRHGASYWLRMQ